MHSILVYLLAAGAGVLIAHFISRAPELRFMRLSQLIFVPAAMVLCVYFLPDGSGSSAAGDLGGLVCFVAVLGFLVLLLAPNMAHLCGAGLSNFLDPQDWTSADEEIALRPIRRLIDKDQFHPALAELDELLKKHKPTYEALLLKARLLYHLGGWDEAVATLLNLIELSQTTQQQLMVMEFLALLEEHHPNPPKPLATGARRIRIRHELVLFQTAGDTSPLHKAIPPGAYEIEEIFRRHRRWLKLAGEDWGNAEMCWEAILAIDRPAAAPPKKGLFWPIARMHQAVSAALKSKRQPRRHLQAEAQKLFHEAKEFIRRDDWHQARPLLQKASACDPDRYEIAYRWVQAVRHTASDAATAQVVSQVLKQSLWTENEQHMLQQLRQPFAK
jgi:thioredoxin-like negative regulator of GroEL